MMQIITTVLGFFLGKKEDLGAANRTMGVINYAWLVPVLGWTWFHRAESITLQVLIEKNAPIELFSTTYLGMAIVAGLVFVYIEFNRRSV